MMHEALKEPPRAADTITRPQAAAMSGPVRFIFTGSGKEYFGIWIVNVLLTILTFGIYSAWAKVRRTRYFYDNTELAGSSFEYHGNPVAILKGRLAAVGLIVAYNLAFRYSVALGFVIMFMMICAAPWLIWKSLQFKLYNSSYRGIRFAFRGTLYQSYKYYLALPLASLFTLYLLAPLTHQRMKKYQHDESRFGQMPFSFHASAGKFYLAYLIGASIAIGGVVVLSALFFGGILASFTGSTMNAAMAPPTILFFVSLYVWMFTLFPIFLAIIQNLIWNNTRLGAHQFGCSLKWGTMLFIAFTNLLGILLTLGLYTPFAQIRSMKYRIESMSLQPQGSLDEFIAGKQAEQSATSEGMSDLLDFDLSL